MRKQGKLVKVGKAAVSFALLLTAVFCVFRRLPECFTSEESAVLAAAFTLTDGQYISENNKQDEKKESKQNATQPTTVSETKATEKTSEKERDKSGYYDSFAKHEGEEKYSIEEKNISGGATKVDNCYIKNKTGLDLDFDSILNDNLQV